MRPVPAPSSRIVRLACVPPAATRSRATVLGDVPVRSRASIGEAPEAGPLLVDEYDTTVVVRPGWSARRDATTETLVLERS